MKSSPDILHHVRLKEKILTQTAQAIPIILNELRTPVNSVFIELAVSILYSSRIDCSEEIIDIITSGQRRVYLLTQLCMLLGFYDTAKSEKILWDYYHYLREHYPRESYSQGPLLGLLEIYDRKMDLERMS